MKILWTILFCGVIVHSFPQDTIQKVGTISKGPNSQVVITGPDGSVIKSDVTGGVVSVGDAILLVPPVQTDVVVPALTTTKSEGSTSVSPVINDVTTEGAGETEITTVLNETQSPSTSESTTSAAGSSPDVEIIEPVTIPPPPPVPVEEGILDLNGPSGRISVSGSRIVVAGPASTLVKENRRQLKEPAKVIESIQPEIKLKGSLHNLGEPQWHQQRVVQLVPGFYGSLLYSPEWANFVLP